MRVLLTGANGFVAPYLHRELSHYGHQILLTGREPSLGNSKNYFQADMTDRKQVFDLIAWAKADAVVHLAGIANVASGDAAQRAGMITSVNVLATSHLCYALEAQIRPSIMLLASTGLVYRPDESPNFQGFQEDSPLGPVNDYGWSKLAAESLARIFDGTHLKLYIVRPFNHIGVGQDSRFVTTALAQRIIDAKSNSEIPVGNLDARRDFTDVRDIVRAYRLILERQPEQRTFVLASGVARPIMDIFRFFVEHSEKNISFKCTDELMRTEQSVTFGNSYLARKVLDWTPEIPFQQTLKELYDHLSQSKNT